MTEKKAKTETQKKIELSAIRLFAKNGFLNTSTKEIALDAGISEGIIFKYYKKKEQLLINLIIPIIEEIKPSVSDSVIELVDRELPETFEEFLRDIMNNRIEFISENQNLFRLLIKELFYREDLRKQLMPYFGESISASFRNVIDYYKNKGEIEQISTNQILENLLTQFGSFFISKYVLMDNYQVKLEDVDQFIRFALYGVKRKEEV